MPKGIILIGWTNKEGFFLIHKYPKDLKISESEIMRIGSLHRMRQLDANVISLKLKKLNVISFFSGLITADYHIAPNFAISLLLDKSEDKKNYIKTLPLGSKIVLEKLPLKRFDARTTTEKEVLANIGISYRETLPKLYEKLINDEISVNEKELKSILKTKTELEKLREQNQKLQDKIVDKEVKINLLKDTIEELTQKLKSKGSIKNIKMKMEEKMKIAKLKNEYESKINELKKELDEVQQRVDEYQETITVLLDYKLVLQQRDEETKIFLKNLLDSLGPYSDDDFHQNMIKNLIQFLEKIEWAPEI
ncbi:MAG: hypothetical protein GF329_15050 [Candidatus Lokiarchaeota archaeon]|nr:hypothetical protein [Candidatus Lokiarchaeota archaeon]